MFNFSNNVNEEKAKRIRSSDRNVPPLDAGGTGGSGTYMRRPAIKCTCNIFLILPYFTRSICGCTVFGSTILERIRISKNLV